MAEDVIKPWIQVSSAIDSVRSSLSAAFREQAGFEKGTGELAKATAKLQQASMSLGVNLAKTNSITRDQARDFYNAAAAVRKASQAARDMELRYKGMALAAMSMGDMVAAAADKITGLGNSIQKLAGIGIAGGVGLKSLTDSNLAFKRSLFESDKIASRYGESLGSLKNAFGTIRKETEMSQQDFANLNKSIKELYLGIPPTAEAIAKMVQELRGRVGFNDDVITKTLESLVGLQNKVPQIMESVSAAWAAAAKGQGDAANKMALQMRLLLSQSGATRGEIEKVMAAMEPRSAGDRSPFLNFEQQMAKAEQRSKDAQVALALKLEPTLRTINTALSKVADVLSGVNGILANSVAGFVALAGGGAIAIKTIMGISNAYKILGTFSKVKLAGLGIGGLGSVGTGLVGAGSRVGGAAGLRLGGGGFAAGKLGTQIGRGAGRGLGAAPWLMGAFEGYDEWSSRKKAGQSDIQAGMHAGGRGAATIAGGWMGAKGGALVGSAFGPVGTLVGGAVGGIAGSMAGSALYKRTMGTASAMGGTGKGEEGKDEDLMRDVEMFSKARKEQTELLASQAGLFSSNYEGGSKQVRKLLESEEGIKKVREMSLAKQAEGKSLTERISYAENELRKGTISRAEAIRMIAGEEKDVATATKEVERISKSLLSVDRQRYEHSTQIISAMEKQIAMFDKLSEAGNSVVDGLAQTISRLQGEGLFRDGFGESFNNAIKTQEANVEISAKKMQAVLFKNLAGRGEIKDLDVFINLKDDKIKEQAEAARKGLKESLSKEDALTLKLSEKNDLLPNASSENAKGLISEIKGLEAELGAAKEASDGFNKTLMGLATVLPDVSGLDDKLTSLTANLQKMKEAGDFGTDYQATINQIKEITAAKEANLLASNKLADVKLQGSEASEKAMLVNNERAVQLSKQRISLAESMNMGMARTWKYTKETVALQERQLQLLTQQSERFGQDMQAAAGPELKLDLNFADADYEGFLADVKRRLTEQQVPLEKQEAIVNNITKAANKRLEVEGKILQTSGEIMETTKQMREGWLEAVQGSMMGFGDMEKIIGTQDKSATQLLRYGAPATYKYGGLMDHRPTELTRPPEYSDIYGAMRGGPNANPFPKTALEGSTGVRDIPYGQYGWDDVSKVKQQALYQAQHGGSAQNTGMLMTMGTEQQDLGMQGIQQASINAATSLGGVKDASKLVSDALTEMAGMITQTQSVSAARAPGQLVSVPWVQGVQPSNNWGAQGAGTASGVSQGSSYLPLNGQNSIPNGGVNIGTHRRGGSVKGYGYGGTLEAGSFIVSEGPTRANADMLSQIPGVRYAAKGGEIGETRAGHDSIYYDVAGYGTGGAVLMPNEAIIPPAFAHLGPSLNHYAYGGTLTGKGSYWSDKVLPRGDASNLSLRPRGTPVSQSSLSNESFVDYRKLYQNNPKAWERHLNKVQSTPVNIRSGPSLTSRLSTAHKGGKAAIKSPVGKMIIGAGMAVEGIDRAAAGENWGGVAGGAAGAGVFLAGIGYVTGAVAAAIGGAGILPFLAAAGLIYGANKGINALTGVDVLGSTYNALTGAGASYGRDSFDYDVSLGTASKASYASGLIHSLPGEIWESTKDLVNPSRMVDISGAYEKVWAKDKPVSAPQNKPVTDGSDLPGIRSLEDMQDAIKHKEWALGKDGGPGVMERIRQDVDRANDPEVKRIQAQNEKRANELRDYKTEMAILVTDGKRYKYQQELKKYKEENPERWSSLVKKHRGNEALTEAAYAQRKINEIKKRALEKGEKTAIQSAREKLSLGYFTGPFASKDSFGEGSLLKVPDPPDWMTSAQDQTHLTSLYAENRPAPIDTDLEKHPVARMLLKQKEGRETLRMAKDGQSVTPAEFQMPSAARINAWASEKNVPSSQLNEMRRKAYEATKSTVSGIEVRHIGSYGKAVQSGAIPLTPDRMAGIGSISSSTLPIVPVNRTIEITRPPAKPTAQASTQPVKAPVQPAVQPPVQTTVAPEQKIAQGAARGGFVGGYRPPRFALGGWAGSSKPNSGRGSMSRRSSERMNAHIVNNGLSAPMSVPLHSDMNNGPMGGGNFRGWSGSVKPVSMRGGFSGLSGSLKDRSGARMSSQLNATARAGYNVGNQAISTAPQKNTPAGKDGAARLVTVKLDASNTVKDLISANDANGMKENRLAIS